MRNMGNYRGILRKKKKKQKETKKKREKMKKKKNKKRELLFRKHLQNWVLPGGLTRLLALTRRFNREGQKTGRMEKRIVARSGSGAQFLVELRPADSQGFGLLPTRGWSGTSQVHKPLLNSRHSCLVCVFFPRHMHLFLVL